MMMAVEFIWFLGQSLDLRKQKLPSRELSFGKYIQPSGSLVDPSRDFA